MKVKSHMGAVNTLATDMGLHHIFVAICYCLQNHWL